MAPASADQVVPALICVLDDPDLDPRMAAAAALAAYGPDARAAVPALTARILKGDSEVRIANMKALESIGTDSVTALPSLAKLFTILDPRVRAEAARVVGRFGSSPTTREAARKYLPDLRRLTADPDTDVRKAAAGAILEIEQK
jgi:HEAT repeat protein